MGGWVGVCLFWVERMYCKEWGDCKSACEGCDPWSVSAGGNVFADDFEETGRFCGDL